VTVAKLSLVMKLIDFLTEGVVSALAHAMMRAITRKLKRNMMVRCSCGVEWPNCKNCVDDDNEWCVRLCLIDVLMER